MANTRKHQNGVCVTRSAPVGNRVSDVQIGDILDTAERHALRIVTTSKDYVRLLGRKGPAEQLVEQSRVIEVEMTFSDRSAPRRIIDAAIAACRQRRLADAKGSTVS